MEKKENLYERAERFGISRVQLVITENTGGTPQGANEEIIKGFYTIANDEVRKRENLISELEAELKKLEDAQIPYVQIAKELVTQLPDLSSLAILEGESVDVKDFDSEKRIYLLISSKSGKPINTERIREWLPVRLNEENLYIKQASAETIGAIKKPSPQETAAKPETDTLKNRDEGMERQKQA